MKSLIALAVLSLAATAGFAQTQATSPATAASAGVPGAKPMSKSADKADANVQKRDDKKAMGTGKAGKAASSASDAAANSGK